MFHSSVCLWVRELILLYYIQQRWSRALASTRLYLSGRQQLQFIKCLKHVFLKDSLFFPAKNLFLFCIASVCPFPFLSLWAVILHFSYWVLHLTSWQCTANFCSTCSSNPIQAMMFKKNVAMNQLCILSFSHNTLLLLFFKAHLEIYFRHINERQIQ